MTVTTVAAVPMSSLAGSLPAATRFGPNLYATAAAGAYLPTVAAQVLEENAKSSAPAERIVLKAQEGNAAVSPVSSDAQQLNQLAERFSVQIDVKQFGQVQEFIPASMHAKMTATGEMLATGKKKGDAAPEATEALLKQAAHALMVDIGTSDVDLVDSDGQPEGRLYELFDAFIAVHPQARRVLCMDLCNGVLYEEPGEASYPTPLSLDDFISYNANLDLLEHYATLSEIDILAKAYAYLSSARESSHLHNLILESRSRAIRALISAYEKNRYRREDVIEVLQDIHAQGDSYQKRIINSWAAKAGIRHRF